MNRSQKTVGELTEELAHKTAAFRVLQQVSSELNSTLDLDEICGIVLRTMDEIFGFKHAMILLLEESGRTLRVAACRGYEDASVGATVPVGVGVIGVVAQRRRMLRVNNLGQQRAYLSTVRDQMAQAGRAGEMGDVVRVPGLPDAECQIAIPLAIKDTLVGVFSVESNEQRVFSERDEVLVAIVANQAASAIHNARLYQVESEGRRELGLAHERLTQLNETLEQRVEARTRQLAQANRELREAQDQLVMREKMASLGELVAGIAHEVNNPLGALSGAADVLTRCIHTVNRVVNQGRTIEDIAQDPALRKALKLLDENNRVVLAASERIGRLVRGLKNFSRLDEAEFKKVDLHEGIDSTLILLQHELKDGIEVVKAYGPIPQILCFPNQLNQAFMNLLRNAIQAVGDRGTIKIETFSEDAFVCVEISDTGRGIAPEHLKRIFDPGFTTRGVGVGTGLGLSVCYRIVQEHRGRIEVESRVGEGSRFTVRLPAHLDQALKPVPGVSTHG